MTVTFTKSAWEDYRFWQRQDRKMLERINSLINETHRTPFEGRGKPEALRHDLSGWWSRRISSEHRMVYRYEGERLIIAQLRHHY